MVIYNNIIIVKIININNPIQYSFFVEGEKKWLRNLKEF